MSDYDPRDEAIFGAVDVEHVFLGACLTDERILADTTLTGDDFENVIIGSLFDRARERHRTRQGVSQALLSDEFPEHMRLIWSATDATGELALAEHHEQAIRDRSTRRKLSMAAVRIGAIAKGNSMVNIVDRARAEVDAALRGDETLVVSMVDDAAEVITEHRTAVTLVPSPWEKVNEIIGGFGPGRMYVVGARPGVGKSAFATQIAYELAAHGPVVFATMEMDKGEVYSRVMSQQAQIYYGATTGVASEFIQARERQFLATGLRDIRVLDSGTQTVGGIRSAARSAARDAPLAGVVVDYIHLLSGGEGENETNRLASITRSLKQLAMDFKVPVIALSQLNRAVTSRMETRPGLGDLRGSGAIEQDADCCLFLYKDAVDEDETMYDRVNVYVAKNRQGPSFVSFALAWQGDFVRMVDL